MIRGRIGPDGLPHVSFVLHGRRDLEVEAILDTALAGKLMLAGPLRALFRGIAPAGWSETELADGSVIHERLYEVSVTFDGERQTVLASFTRSVDTLIGVGLLAGRRVVIDFASGDVTIERVAP